MRRLLCLCIVVLVSSGTPPAVASTWLIPPVDAPVARRFEAPSSEWGPGHRGIDYAIESGTLIRAVADGRVSFAGDVAGVLAVTIDHGGGMESTYSDLSEVLVLPGEVVEQGFWIGRTGRAHPDHPGLHLGLKLSGAYVDPESFIGPLDTSGAIRLAPLVWEPPPTLPAAFRKPLLSANAVETCEPLQRARADRPNDNIAVLVAGIGSKTAGGFSAALYESGGRLLGYRDDDTYLFSYRGSEGRQLHQPYERTHTYADIRVAASRLRTMLERVARRHPGRSVDLVAHSQGGIVARSYLELSARAWDPDLPRVEHLLTFSSPHRGAPLAAATPKLDAGPTGKALLEAASLWSRHGGPVPDPYAPSVAQLAPGSGLMDRLDKEAVVFGTRVLSLAIPNDVVVPADHARWLEYPSVVVPPEGLNGHEAVVTSAAATAAAARFLRDGPAPCRSTWDLWGPRIGAGVSAIERAVPWLLGR